MLITGGTGSFGHRVGSYLLKHNPASIRIYSRDEKKQWEMQRAFPMFDYFIGDVRDRDRLRPALRGVDFVFHAAALKQVPACEIAPSEALKTNTIGSLNVCEEAIAAGVRCVVALSTDKAVKPINAMGMTKALMEKIVCSQNRAGVDTIFACVRYGNVMGSRGSVIPYFRQLISQGRPLTVTVPEMTRFLLTLDDSVDLVVRAMTTAKGGEIFVRKAPACTVIDLAESMRREYSEQGEEHPIEIVGVRPGEKIHEILVNEYEMMRAVEDDEYFTIFPEYVPGPGASQHPVGYEYTSENTDRISDHRLIGELLHRVGDVVEYS